MIQSLSLVMPMYNEIENIERAIDEARRMAEEAIPDFEIVVVDDASTDGSGALVDRLARVDPRVRVIHHPQNRKLGGALRTGFAAATKEWVLYTDSDLPIDMADAQRAFPLADEADIVIGYRISRHEGWKREVMSWVYNRLIRALFGLRVRDVNFAFKLFRRGVLGAIRLESEGSFIDAEFLIEACRAGFTLREVGMPYYARQAGVSTLAGPRVVLRILDEMGRYWWHGFRSPQALPHRQRG
jgi:glycosyltransferase involved in cell wall biosynthesis